VNPDLLDDFGDFDLPPTVKAPEAEPKVTTPVIVKRDVFEGIARQLEHPDNRQQTKSLSETHRTPSRREPTHRSSQSSKESSGCVWALAAIAILIALMLM
jgi:hypothetical protein